MKQSMNILVTGGFGYLGSVLVDCLLSSPVDFQDPSWRRPAEVKVRVIDNLMYKQDGMTYFLSRHSDRLKFIHGDVRDSSLLEKHANWADVIIPLAAIVGMPACEKDKTLAVEVNQNHVVKLASLVKNTDKYIVYPNTNSGYGLGLGTTHCTEETPLTPISTYGKTKCAAEGAVLDCGGVALRLATVFGASPRMRLDLLVNDFTYKAFTDGYVVLFEKDFKRNYIHVQDVAAAFCKMVADYHNYRGEVFNVGLSNANLSKWELCQMIKKYVPNFSIQVDEIRKDPDQRNYIVSNEKIEKTGWTPRYTLDYGIKELLNCYSIIAPASKRYVNA